MNSEKLAVIALNMILELTPRKTTELINTFGSAENVLSASEKDLLSVENIAKKTVDAIKKASYLESAEKEAELAKKHNIMIISYTEEEYPFPLKDICDFPVILYVSGKLIKNDEISISVVGSRTPTNYGRAVTSNFCKYFAENDISIVSGLARGIDCEAHTAALKYGGRTVAVLGNGLLHYYPAENRRLQDKISQNCAVLSEFPLQQRPDKINFPRRNRIVAALSLGTLIVESVIASGAMITARAAAETGRDVFAVPGPVFSEYSKGPNKLIKDGAFAALTPEDITGQIQYLSDWIKVKKKQKKQKKTNISYVIDKKAQQVINLIETSNEGISIDILTESLKLNIAELSGMLTELEIQGVIRAMPGQIYMRNR